MLKDLKHKNITLKQGGGLQGVTNSNSMLRLLAELCVVGADVASSLGCAVMAEVAVWELGQR